jgi:hypothetical protein
MRVILFVCGVQNHQRGRETVCAVFGFATLFSVAEGLSKIALLRPTTTSIKHAGLRSREGGGKATGLFSLIATAEGKSISVSIACIGSAGPPTTALRYLSVLDEKRFVERFKYATDARLIHVRLTDLAMAKMSAILPASIPASPLLL